MKYHFLKLILLIAVLIYMVACNNTRETPEDVLKRLGLGEEAFSKLPACDQIKIFAEVGYEFMDVEHGSVGNPSWMYDELRKHDAEVNSACIKRQILEYISLINQNRDVYKEYSLKIHALIYLSESLDLIKNPDIIDVLKIIVCDDQVELYHEKFTVLYYLTQKNKLPEYYSSTPEGLEKLRLDACEF